MVRLILLSVLVLSFSLQSVAAPNNAQLNTRIKTLQQRVDILEKIVADLQKSDAEFIFAGFTVEEIEPDVPSAFSACREQFGPDASAATTQEVWQALRTGTFLARVKGYVLSAEVQYNMGLPKDRYLLAVLHGPFVVVGVGGETFQDMPEQAPVACSMPKKS